MELNVQAPRRDAARNAMVNDSLQAIYVGGFLGFYDALAAAPALSASELAARTGTHEGYVRAWLERQAALGLVEEVDASIDPGRYRLAADLDGLPGSSDGVPPFRRCLW